uniref:(northern house mosquito) hypothetical protein n=1 Tax=Culex pipiens TaxID=7175 RepID=A0A8D8CPW7_CULPI
MCHESHGTEETNAILKTTLFLATCRAVLRESRVDFETRKQSRREPHPVRTKVKSMSRGLIQRQKSIKFRASINREVISLRGVPPVASLSFTTELKSPPRMIGPVTFRR